MMNYLNKLEQHLGKMEKNNYQGKSDFQAILEKMKKFYSSEQRDFTEIKVDDSLINRKNLNNN